MKRALLGAIFCLSLGFAYAAAAQQASVSNRSAEVRVVFSNSKMYAGTYTSKAVARVCGQTDPIYFGRKTFDFEFPVEVPAGDAIQDVTFSSDELVDGKKTTAAFSVAVNIQSPKIGHPPAWVVDTTDPHDRSSGSVTLSGTSAELAFTATAVNSLKEKLELTVTCHPPK